MSDILVELYNIVEKRKAEREEGSYTVYLIDAGLDKILKKLGEEAAETIIAAKNLAAEGNTVGEEGEEREALKNEVADLLYHLIVMLHQLGIEPYEIETILRLRMQKTGNMKKSYQADKNS